jgi:hypothetical protein
MKNPHLVTQALMVVLIGAVCWMCYRVGRLAAPAANVTPGTPVRPPAPAADAATLGRAYVPTLGATYGEAWQAASKAVAEGKSVADAREVLQDTWRESRERAFAAKVAPAFSRVLPEGAEPATPEKRAEVARMFHDFGAGLKGGK